MRGHSSRLAASFTTLLFGVVALASSAVANPGLTGIAPMVKVAAAKDTVRVGYYKKRRKYRRNYYKRKHTRRHYRRHRRQHVHVDAPFTRYSRHHGRVAVDAPFATVRRSRHGVYVRAPFVDLWVPRY